MFGVVIGAALAAAVIKGLVYLCGHRITWRLALMLAVVVAACFVHL